MSEVILPNTDAEWEILAHRWPNLPEQERETLSAAMSRAQQRRFERTTAKLHEGQRHFAGKLATREDVVQINALFIERQVLPIAARLDKVEAWIAYRELPVWKRARVTLVAWVAGAMQWLESKGITFVEIPGSEGAVSGDAPAAIESAEGHPTEPEVHTPSAIEVVSR